jgi:DNA-binding LacI/PurR family transcriptional regulator
MSIANVARIAGVSQATVSRVINKRPGVSSDLTRLVREAMGTLNYTPPPPDRRPGRRIRPEIRPKDTTAGMIAVVVLDNLYQYTPGIFALHLRGIELEAADHGLAMIVTHSSATTSLSAAIDHSRLKGLILMGSRAASESQRWIGQFPSVWLSSHHGPGGDTVLAGNAAIARLAADYLLRRGHKRLAFLAIMSSYPAYPARAEAFQFAAAQAGATVTTLFDPPDDTEKANDFPDLPVLQQRMEALADQFKKLSPMPTGLFVPNDMMTSLAYVSLRRRGIVPGRDVEIISCNNEASYLIGLDPRPATIDIGAEMIGRCSVEQLLRRIRHPEEQRPIQIAISPIVVESPEAGDPIAAVTAPGRARPATAR